MDKMNYNMIQLHDQLTELINNCQLPVGAAYYICKDVFSELERAFQQCIKSEAEAPAPEPVQYAINAEDLATQEQIEGE